MSFTKDKIPNEVFESFKNRNSCFFIGAGLSVGAGYPTWQGLLEKLIQILEQDQWFNKSKLDDYKQLVSDPNKFLFLAEDIKTEMGGRFSELMKEWFGKPNAEPTENHLLLAQIPSDLIITINYDRLIENAFNRINGYFPNVYTYRDSKEMANLFWKRDFFILKAHGDASQNPDGLILSQRDYRKTLYRETGYRSLLQSIFSTKSIFFIGVSLNDPEFNQLLDYLHDSYHGGGPQHYLLMDTEKIPPTLQKGYLEHFKIRTITYENPDGKHGAVTDFLKILREELPQ
jgi:SIR2-like domain